MPCVYRYTLASPYCASMTSPHRHRLGYPALPSWRRASVCIQYSKAMSWRASSSACCLGTHSCGRVAASNRFAAGTAWEVSQLPIQSVGPVRMTRWPSEAAARAASTPPVLPPTMRSPFPCPGPECGWSPVSLQAPDAGWCPALCCPAGAGNPDPPTPQLYAGQNLWDL